MRLMKYVDQRNGIYRVRMKIPDAALHAFPDLPKSGDYAVSLGTRDEREAFDKAPPIIAALLARIADALKSASAPQAPASPSAAVVFSPAAVKNAIDRWKVRTITEAQHQQFNGLAIEMSPFGAEASALSTLRYNLAEFSRWGLIPDFTQRMADALRSEGLAIATGHPLLGQKAPRLWFGAAWADVERHLENFRRGDLDSWPEEPEEAPQAATAALTPQLAPTGGTTLKALLEQFLTSQKPKSEDDIRLHWRRLVEHLGDVDAGTVTPKKMDNFLVQLRRFPKTRKPEIEAKTFPEIMAQHAGEGLPLLSPTTVWKYFTSYQMVFGWAARIREIPFNPVEGAMPTKPKSDKKVMPYEPEQIAALFAKPMFTGCSRTHDRKGNLWGYRHEPGDLLLKDGRYWMPILNLYHGNRMEEWGGAKVADIKAMTVDDNEIVFLDLRERALKTPQANRRLPIHPAMKGLGFLDYVAERRKAKDEYLFPEFPHDVSEAEDPEASTRLFSKWWGLWSDANGFPDPSLNFHSFRHSFIRACRGKIDPEIRGLLTGHKGKVNEGSEYGDGAELQVLAEAIAKVEYPTFPKLP